MEILPVLQVSTILLDAFEYIWLCKKEVDLLLYYSLYNIHISLTKLY